VLSSPRCLFTSKSTEYLQGSCVTRPLHGPPDLLQRRRMERS
ncbi:hypothetical protein CSUI_010939, partial [Cystoisospora suis]